MNRLRAVLVSAVIPWIPAVPHATPSPALAPPCKPGSLRASTSFQGATGNWAGAIILTNAGRQPCSLAGRPTVRFVDGALNPAGVVFTRLKPFAPEDSETYPSPKSLDPGAAAYVSVWWSNWCGTSSPNDLALTLATGTIVVRVDGTARCDAPSDASTVAVTPFEPRGVPAPHTSQLPLAAVIVE